MDGVSLPYLPVSLWILTGAMTILILFVVFGFYIYWRNWARNISKTGSDLASLSARKLILEQEKAALEDWLKVNKDELDRVKVERDEQERLRTVLADIEQQCAIKNQENQTLRNEVGELENQRYHLTQSLERIQREIGDLEAKRNEAQAIESRLAELRSRLEDAQQTLRNLVELEVKLNSLSNEKTSLERAIEGIRSAEESARVEAGRLKEEAAQARLNVEQIWRELEVARREKAESEVTLEILHRKKHALENTVERLEDKVETLNHKVEDLKTSARKAEDEARRNTQQAQQTGVAVERAGRELATFVKDRQRVEIEVGQLNAQKAILAQELARLEGKLGSRPGEDKDALAAYADLLEKSPLCLSKGAFVGRRDDQDESELLQKLKRTLRNEGLIFPSRIIDAFHTSLKCHAINPITVLAGVSGTGKTLLPVRYAEIMGMHRLVMAVQPRWDSPQDMFGFYNYLEKEYKATELSRALVRMDPYNYPESEFPKLKSHWAKDRLLLVLIDEMNLARTEYYFSEFLSRLELRRAVKDASVREKRSEAEIELDAGPGKYRFRLWVEHNVFFVGTMNEDETTQTLSDKVLDRANVLRFGKPDENARAVRNGQGAVLPANERFLSFEQWKNWQREFKEGAEWYDPVSQWTTRLNSALNRVGRPFGFRVFDAIGHYVANYPRVEDGDRYRLAFADQVEQKIIPKIRGIDLSTDSANECLSEIEMTIAELGDRELSDAFSLARTESRMIGMFQWRGVTRRMVEDTPTNAH
jgi:predicted  nucleic acid-binding Zn-ribbon protein